jgi:hypothetical protein
MPSFEDRPTGVVAPAGYRLSNPSIARRGDHLMMVQRCVNYSATSDGRYVTEGNVAHHTRNFLIHLSDRLGIAGAAQGCSTLYTTELIG